MLANSRVWKPRDDRTGRRRVNDWSASEVVEGVVDRRRRVGDRQQAGVIEAREAREYSLAVVEEDRAVLADLREDTRDRWRCGSRWRMGRWAARRRCSGRGCPRPPVPKSAPALKVRPGVSTNGIGLPPLMSMFITWLPKALVLIVSELDVGRRVDDVGRRERGQRARAARCSTR